MRIRLAVSATETRPEDQYLTSFLIDERVAVDAGALGLVGSPDAQMELRHVFVSHTHADHLATLPIFVENVFRGGEDCIVVHGSESVQACIREDVFNDRLWPDFFRLAKPGSPFLQLRTLEAEVPVEVEGLRVTPIEVDHIVPTFGFLIEDDHSAAVFATDTGPTHRLWDVTNGEPKVKAVFLDASFPESMAELADVSGHLTPSQFAAEMRKVERDVLFVAVHIKARFRDEVVRDFERLGVSNLEIGQPGKEYVL